MSPGKRGRRNRPGQPKDRVVFAKVSIGQPAAEQWEKVNADDESVENVFRAMCALSFRQVHQQRQHEEHRQDVAHAVKAEALATLVADDVADLRGNPCRRRCDRRRDMV
jgi:uncharacterized NAD(P)/FAD-binding protein YdhS